MILKIYKIQDNGIWIPKNELEEWYDHYTKLSVRLSEEEHNEWYNYYHEIELKEAKSNIDWLNAHHFDYRNLLAKGLAIAVNENNNPYIID